MRALFTASVLALTVVPVWAVNKCKAADGKVLYQDAPCSPVQQTETLKLRPNGSTTSGGAEQLQFKIVPLPQDQIKDVAVRGVATAKGRLKDPDSAKFSDLRVLSFDALGRNYTMACGDLNAKNSFGGYVGSKPFWVYDGVFTETYDHFMPGSNLRWLMGNVQAACLKEGAVAPL